MICKFSNAMSRRFGTPTFRHYNKTWHFQSKLPQFKFPYLVPSYSQYSPFESRNRVYAPLVNKTEFTQ